MSKILITGGAGFIGSHTADYFIDKGFEVNVIDNLSESIMVNLIHSMAEKEIDIADKEFIRSIGFLDECVKSILYRDMGYDHPLSGLIKHIVEATKSKNGKEIATRFNTPTVAEIIDYLEGGEDE